MDIKIMFNIDLIFMLKIEFFEYFLNENLSTLIEKLWVYFNRWHCKTTRKCWSFLLSFYFIKDVKLMKFIIKLFYLYKILFLVYKFKKRFVFLECHFKYLLFS